MEQIKVSEFRPPGWSWLEAVPARLKVRKAKYFCRISTERLPIKASTRWIKRNEVWKFQFFILWPLLNSEWRWWKVKNDFLSSLVRETENSFEWRSWYSHVFIDIYYLNLVYQILWLLRWWIFETQKKVTPSVVRLWTHLEFQLLIVLIVIELLQTFCGSLLQVVLCSMWRKFWLKLS